MFCNFDNLFFYCSIPRILFLDMNSFFASVEQQENINLRNKPIAVVPVDSNGTSVISASYEARAFGIKTGTMVSEAKILCPNLKTVLARPRVYVHYNKKIVETLHNFFVEINELSVDEMACLLPPSKRTDQEAVLLAKKVKQKIKLDVGDYMNCSIGIAPNIFLAKVASDFQKPDGLTLFTGDYKEKLFSLSLKDLPGIARQNEKRLRSCGIYSVKDLWEADLKRLRSVWGGTIGERWHYMLRGNLDIDYGNHFIGTQKKSVSQSHVLPPRFRNLEGARDMLLRITAKALKRLRSYYQLPKTVLCRIGFRHNESWSIKTNWDFAKSYQVPANDDLCWFPMIYEAASKIKMDENFRPTKVSVVFVDLYSSKNQQTSFLEDRTRFSNLFYAIDKIKDKFDTHVHIAQILHILNEAPPRISFGGTIKDEFWK